MTSDRDDVDRLAIEINECKHMGIKVLPPDINEGFIEFAVVPDKKEIRFGMAAVKGVGTGAVEEILRAREEGKFVSVEDFAKRVSTARFNRKAWESLIKSGGFDSLGDRSDLLFNLDTIQAFASKLQKEASSGQIDLFGGLGQSAQIMPMLSLQPAPLKHTARERLMWERELLGLYVSAHPLDNYDTYFEEQTVPLAQITPEMEGKKATIGGLIMTVRTIITKNGSRMAFVKVEDKTGEAEIIVFPNLFEQIGAKLVQDAVIRATGKINSRDRNGNQGTEAKMIADEIQFVTEQELSEYHSTGRKMSKPKVKIEKRGEKVAKSRPIRSEVFNVTKKIYVHIKNPDDHDTLFSLKQVCSDHPGESDIVLVLGTDKKSAIKLPFKVSANDNLVGQLVKILDEDSVVLK